MLNQREPSAALWCPAEKARWLCELELAFKPKRPSTLALVQKSHR